jgi:hypothetical protein
MRSAFFLFVLSVVLLGCNYPPPPGSISQVNSETQVVLQSETDNHEVIQEFDLNNCDGKADATRTEHRSSSIDVTISTELAATIGASAQVISAEVQAVVGTALRIGGDRGTSMELKAPPNTHMFFQLAWVGKSRIGVVQNVGGSNIPIAFQSFTPDNVRIKSQYDVGCRNTPPPEPTKTPANSPTFNQSCPLIVIEGKSGGLPIAQTVTWSELALQRTTREPQSANLNDACSRDMDDRVHVFLGYWEVDTRHLVDYGSMTLEDAISLINRNPNQPTIIVPWGE